MIIKKNYAYGAQDVKLVYYEKDNYIFLDTPLDLSISMVESIYLIIS